MKKQIRIDIIREFFATQDGTYDLDNAKNLSGKIAGVCYDREGFAHLEHEPIEKTNRRINMTLENGHHSVYDHLYIKLNLQNLPKILAMVLNNEKQYTTSEKSARYTPIEVDESCYIYKEQMDENSPVITCNEVELYNKWLEIFKIKIKEKYGYIYNDSKIVKLAQENARYLVTVFMPTQMVHTISLRQINYVASWMMEYIEKSGREDATEFEKRLAPFMEEFILELNRNNMLVPELLYNDKCRSLSLFGENLDSVEEYFGHVYATVYKSSLAELAQAQRHRTIDYQMEFLDDKEYFIPPIIADDPLLVSEWLNDMDSVKEVTPQGELVKISEMGTYTNFILKCKERLCSAAQLEIMRQTRDTLLKYRDALVGRGSPLSEDIEKYTKGARCTFPDFKCRDICSFKEGKTLTRRI